MEIIIELTTWQGETVKVSARKSPSDSYKPDESDPTVTEFVVELDDYSEKDEQQYFSYCSNTPRKWSK
jgi:hypothetical protein|tara:strand:+ start:358 stop:561 length:204 start_codon:yes stop_codon:yes gene_type:complete